MIFKKSKKTIANGEDFKVVEYQSSINSEQNIVIVDHPGTSIIVTKSGSYNVMVFQNRPAIDQITLEFPGGVREKEESPDQAAIREFYEETGYKLKNAILMGSMFASVGTSNEKYYFFEGFLTDKIKNIRIINSKTQFPSSLTNIEIVLVAPDILEGFIFSNVIEDAKTSLAYYLSSKRSL